MNFFSLSFVLFYSITFLIYHAVPYRFKHYILLAASITFYALFDIKYTLILLFVIVFSYFMALSIEKRSKCGNSKGWLAIGIILCVFVLVFFKFWNYALVALDRVFGFKGLAQSGAAAILAPVGISFFSLEAIGYMVDVYRGKTKAEKDFGKYTLFISFFPKIMSGPIDRSTNLLKQIREGVGFSYDQVKHGFLLILWGSFIKLLIANRLAVIVDFAFKNYNEQTGFTMLIAVILYGLQLYVDFSGYSYIAIGLAGTFGYTLIDNFIQPYFALNVRDFWRRWHVSLSSWLRDYVYIPLGGNKKGTLRRYINLMITFVVSGLWHGTGMHFVIWGFFHGVMQVCSILLEKIASKRTTLKETKDSKSLTFKFSSRFIKAIFTFALVDFAWLFFRADSVGAAFEILHKIVFNPEVGRTIYDGLCFAGVEIKKGGVLVAELLLLFGVELCHEKKIKISDWLDRQDKWFRWGVYITIAMLIILGLIRNYGIDASTFIYANF